MSENSSQLIVALDYPGQDAALAMADMLDPDRCRVKVGKELFTRAGPQVVRTLADRGFDVFLDLKFHDIPHTVARAVLAAAEAGAWMVNVHASGGRRMLAAAREALDELSEQERPLLIAVTVLTSMGQDELGQLGIDLPLEEQVLKLAGLAHDEGLDGVVCSAQEAAAIKRHCGRGFATVTPGIRPTGSASGDQTRVMTPGDAIRAGADYLVVGRPITGVEKPMEVVAEILAEVASAK